MTSTLLQPSRNATPETSRYARCIEASKRVRWDIDRDVIRGRRFDLGKKFLPDGLSKVDELEFLSAAERRLLSQIQGRTYANMFGLVERYIGAKTIELGRSHGLGDQVALEALVRMTDEELKHQELFRRLERLMAQDMPAGYDFKLDPDAVASAVLAKGNWAVLALTLHIEIFTLAHYRASIEFDPDLSELWKDVFRFHWMEESQHAILDELELRREHARLDAAARDQGVAELIELVGAVDGLLQVQSQADADYFVAAVGRKLTAAQVHAVQDLLLKAYRWQYIVSGVKEPRFAEALTELTTEAQRERIFAAAAPIVAHVAS
jgi:hypothetical protein